MTCTTEDAVCEVEEANCPCHRPFRLRVTASLCASAHLLLTWGWMLPLPAIHWRQQLAARPSRAPCQERRLPGCAAAVLAPALPRWLGPAAVAATGLGYKGTLPPRGLLPRSNRWPQAWHRGENAKLGGGEAVEAEKRSRACREPAGTLSKARQRARACSASALLLPRRLHALTRSSAPCRSARSRK